MELIHTEDARVTELAAWLIQLKEGPATKDEHDRHLAVLTTCTALEVNAAIDQVLCTADSIDEWKTPVARFMRSVSKTLDAADLPEYPAGHLLADMDAMTDRVNTALSTVQAGVKAVREGRLSLADLAEPLAGLEFTQGHYETLQNTVFPLFEKATPQHACVKLMWSLQNDALTLYKRLKERIRTAEDPDTAFWKDIGDFFLLVGNLAWRERRVLYPAAYRAISPDQFSQKTAGEERANPLAFVTSTGSLDPVALASIFKVLPIDISFIGADDRVQFYSDPPHRIFPRSPAVIGRLVQNCHPPKSVATVEEILRSFKDGSRDSADFYLTLNGRFIRIQYFAVRDDEGRYLGTLEVSQDGTEMRALTGEKRLL